MNLTCPQCPPDPSRLYKAIVYPQQWAIFDNEGELMWYEHQDDAHHPKEFVCFDCGSVIVANMENTY